MVEVVERSVSAVTRVGGRSVVSSDVHQLVRALAKRLEEVARESVESRGVFHLALSGGSTPWRLYDELACGDERRSFPWHGTHVWVVDDRCVPSSDSRNNSAALQTRLVSDGPLLSERFHPMEATLPGAAERYESEMRQHLTVQAAQASVHGARLDAVLLGMGTDGHTASLFPHSPALKESRRWVVLNDGDRVIPPRPRITMTYPVLAASRYVFVLVTGEEKRSTLARVASENDPDELPILGLTPSDDSVFEWYLDEAAAL